MRIHIFRDRTVKAFANALLVVFVAASSALAEPRDTESANVEALHAVHIDNFGRVDANLYRGAQPQGRDYADLRALGIKTIVNLTSDDADPNERVLSEAAGMTYVAIPMTTRTVPTAAQLAQFLRLVNDPSEQPVYVHCVGGRHRTGVMTAIYRMTHDGWSGDRAFKEMKQFKYGADFLHPEFKDFVYSYRPKLVATTAMVPANAAAQH